MTSEEVDRVVSRRVEHATAADPGDERVHRAADPEPDGDQVQPPRGASPDDGSEPTRSE